MSKQVPDFRRWEVCKTVIKYLTVAIVTGTVVYGIYIVIGIISPGDVINSMLNVSGKHLAASTETHKLLHTVIEKVQEVPQSTMVMVTDIFVALKPEITADITNKVQGSFAAILNQIGGIMKQVMTISIISNNHEGRLKELEEEELLKNGNQPQ